MPIVNMTEIRPVGNESELHLAQTQGRGTSLRSAVGYLSVAFTSLADFNATTLRMTPNMVCGDFTWTAK